MAEMSQEHKDLLKRCVAETPSLKLLTEVNTAKERLVKDQNFDAAAEFCNAERKLQTALHCPPGFKSDMERFGFSLEIKRRTIVLDPSVDVFQVGVGKGEGVWMETIPTEENLYWFLRGLRALSPAGLLPEHEIPRRGGRTGVVQEDLD